MKRKSTNALKLDKELEFIYPSFKNYLSKNLVGKNFLIGVSGGADSLALAYLSSLILDEKKYNLHAIIVDHGVRKGSDIEAKKVQSALKKLKIKTNIFKINFKKTNNFHSTARQKRYDKMIDFCKKKSIKNIVLAHHYDDQIENFYIRLSRGSGLAGLSPIKKKSRYKNIALLRPLLDFKKKELLKITKKKFNFYVKDASNFDDKYLRSRVRKFRSFMESEGLEDNRLINTLNNLEKAREAIDYYTQEASKKFIKIEGLKISFSKKLFTEPREVIFRSVSNFLSRAKNYPSRSKGIDRLIDELSQKNKKKVTLGGYVFENGLNFVKVTKETRKRR